MVSGEAVEVVKVIDGHCRVSFAEDPGLEVRQERHRAQSFGQAGFGGTPAEGATKPAA